jgi:hypothetical protein
MRRVPSRVNLEAMRREARDSFHALRQRDAAALRRYHSIDPWPACRNQAFPMPDTSSRASMATAIGKSYRHIYYSGQIRANPKPVHIRRNNRESTETVHKILNFRNVEPSRH